MDIESILNEVRRFAPSGEFAEKANVGGRRQYDDLVGEFERDWDGAWAKQARDLIEWQKPFSEVCAGTVANSPRWFADGKLNVSANCLDRHLKVRGKQTAIIFEADDGETEHITYETLFERVCQFANALTELGVKRGDTVIIYMPMRPEAVVAMQASARIGAIHSVVFGGFSAKSLAERVEDVAAKVVITANESVRGGKSIPLKRIVDEALADNSSVEKVVVFKRTTSKTEMKPARDLWWSDVINNQPSECEPAVMSAEDALFVLYTSGSTGKPKGIQHTSAGYLLGTILSMLWVFDHRAGDVYWCTADVGWITGHTYVCYGPLAVGATQVIFEGVPTFPHAGRFWEIVQKHKVTTFYTAPTAIRTLMAADGDAPKRFDLSSLRLLGTVGEPINPEAWMWYHTQIGNERCPIVDTWWQTETGSNMIAPVPGAIVTKPGSCTLPLPGIAAAVIDEDGNELPRKQGGILVIKKSWPSQARTIWGDYERYKDTYFPRHIANGNFYVTGDSAYRDEDGYFWIMGRMDDVLNVSGHRLGTMEVESALVANPRVAEAAVVGCHDDLTGQAIFAFVVVHGKRPTGQTALDVKTDLRNWVGKEIGAIAKPKHIRFGTNLPKTRSGKIMRRLLRAIANGEEITQDTSTLENPDIVEQLKTAN